MNKENLASKNRLRFLKYRAENEWGVHLGLADKFLLFKEVFPCDEWSFFGKLDHTVKKYDFNSKQMELYRSKQMESQTEDVLRWVKMSGHEILKKKNYKSDNLVLSF